MRRVVSGHFMLPMAAKTAIGFFTPEGERGWVPGWNPVYAGGDPSEASGTLFTTDVGGRHTIWLIQRIDRDGCRADYVRVTPGHHAGTVKVRCDDQPDGGCVVEVTYEMSPVPGADPDVLEPYADGPFRVMLDEWETAVARMV